MQKQQGTFEIEMACSDLCFRKITKNHIEQVCILQIRNWWLREIKKLTCGDTRNKLAELGFQPRSNSKTQA